MLVNETYQKDVQHEISTIILKNTFFLNFRCCIDHAHKCESDRLFLILYSITVRGKNEYWEKGSDMERSQVYPLINYLVILRETTLTGRKTMLCNITRRQLRAISVVATSLLSGRINPLKRDSTFLKRSKGILETLSSGPPNWIKTPEDAKEYIDRYFEKEGVSLDGEKIEKNPGMRALAKLCLNSFWGKFGQRLNLKQSQFFHETEVDAFFRVLSDPTKDVQDFHIVANDTIQVEWTYKKDCQPVDNKTNIYLATFTTCWARLKLYSILEKIDRNVLYYDTDSVIYVSKTGENDVPLGDYLGELTNELETGEHIIEFVSGGPKNYAYKTNKGNETCKVRGFTLNFTNSQLINFESVKTLLIDPSEKSTITVTNPHKICRDKGKRKLYNREEEKNYRMVYTKRRRLDNYDTEPYGY